MLRLIVKRGESGVEFLFFSKEADKEIADFHQRRSVNVDFNRIVRDIQNQGLA
jgi:hypothetical protein